MVAHQVVRDLHELRDQQERMLRQSPSIRHDGWSRAVGVGMVALAITAWVQPGWLAAMRWEPLLLGVAGLYLLKPGSRRER